MSAINPVSGASGSHWATSAPPARPDKPAGGGFADALGKFVDRVDGEQQASAKAVEDLLTGKTQDVLPAVAAVAKADMSFKLLVGVRNKMIEAYKQTINMQV